VLCLWVASVTTLPSLFRLFARRAPADEVARLSIPWADRLSRLREAVRDGTAPTRGATTVRRPPPDPRTTA
jgi:hypothetical protein